MLTRTQYIICLNQRVSTACSLFVGVQITVWVYSDCKQTELSLSVSVMRSKLCARLSLIAEEMQQQKTKKMKRREKLNYEYDIIIII